MDLFLFNAIHGLAFRFELLDFLFVFFAKNLGYFLIILSFFFLLKDFRKYKFLPVLTFFSGFFTRYGVVELIRFFSYRNRPFIDENIVALFEHASTSSFPSGHASFFFAFSTIVFLYNKKAGYFFYVASFLIGFSRIVSGIHWPLDILVGAIIGIATGYFILIVFKKILTKFKYNF